MGNNCQKFSGGQLHSISLPPEHSGGRCLFVWGTECSFNCPHPCPPRPPKYGVSEVKESTLCESFAQDGEPFDEMPQAEDGKCEANDIVVEAIVSTLSLGKK